MQAEHTKEAQIKVGLIGVGGAGISISNFLLRNSKGFSSSLGIDSDELALYKSNFSDQLLIEDITEKNAENIIAQHSKSIVKFLKEHHVIVLVAGLGRNVGTYVSREILALSLKEKVPVLPIVTSPFSFETEYRSYVCIRGEENLFLLTRIVCCTPNDMALDALGEGTGLRDLYAYMDKSILEDLTNIHESYEWAWKKASEYSHSIHLGLKKAFSHVL